MLSITYSIVLGIVLKSVYKNKLCIFIINFMVLSRFLKGLQNFF